MKKTTESILARVAAAGVVLFAAMMTERAMATGEIAHATVGGKLVVGAAWNHDPGGARGAAQTQCNMGIQEVAPELTFTGCAFRAENYNTEFVIVGARHDAGEGGFNLFIGRGSSFAAAEAMLMSDCNDCTEVLRFRDSGMTGGESDWGVFPAETCSLGQIPRNGRCIDSGCMEPTPILDGGNCRMLMPGDCGMNGLPAFFDDDGETRSCVESCPAERPGNDGTSCRMLAPGDCGMDGRADFFDNDACVASCPDERPEDDGPGSSCRMLMPGDCGADGRPDFFDDDGETRSCVESCPDERPENNGVCTDPSNPPAASADSGADNHNDSVIKIAGVAGVVAFMYAFYEAKGDVDAFSFSPDFGYAITESGYSYKYGGRVDFVKDNWSLYWTAGRRNADGDWGDFRYESGGEYDGGFWRAAFAESAAGDVADYDFSLSADIRGGGGQQWRLSPTYRFHSRLTDGESESGNALSLEGFLRHHRWTISSSAGFRWRRAGDFGGDAKFGLSAAREF